MLNNNWTIFNTHLKMCSAACAFSSNCCYSPKKNLWRAISIIIGCWMLVAYIIWLGCSHCHRFVGFHSVFLSISILFGWWPQKRILYLIYLLMFFGEIKLKFKLPKIDTNASLSVYLLLVTCDSIALLVCAVFVVWCLCVLKETRNHHIVDILHLLLGSNIHRVYRARV